MKSPLNSYKLDTLRGHPMRPKEGANPARDTVPFISKNPPWRRALVRQEGFLCSPQQWGRTF